MAAQYRFSKSERLCSRNLIDTLFSDGHRLLVFPFSIRWIICPEGTIPTRAQVLITAPKKKFHHAVDRNRIKRLIRECYRLQKPTFYSFLDEKDIQIVLSITYIHHELLDYDKIQAKFLKTLSKLTEQITESL